MRSIPRNNLNSPEMPKFSIETTISLASGFSNEKKVLTCITSEELSISSITKLSTNLLFLEKY